MQNGNSRPIPEQPQLRQRRGYTLIHCLVAITLLATVSTIASQLISTLLRTERQGIVHITRLSSLSRLSRTFRADAHAASTCEPLDQSDNRVVRLTMPSRETVVYARHDRGITRTQKKGDQIVNQNLFRLSDVQLRYERANEPSKIVTLVIGLPVHGPSKEKGGKSDAAAPDDRPPLEFRVDAQLGRNAPPANPVQ